MKYVQLEKRNDWGLEFYEVPPVIALFADSKRAKVFTEGQKINIRWPSGKEAVKTVKHKEFRTTVSDHGNTYPVQYSLAGFEVKIHGVKRWIALNEVEVAI